MLCAISELLSGRWKGLYQILLPTGFGKTHAFEVSLDVQANGIISGTGQDVKEKEPDVDFSINGGWDSSGRTVLFTKSYVEGSDLFYRGSLHSNNTISGGWTLGTDVSGTFSLEPGKSREG